MKQIIKLFIGAAIFLNLAVSCELEDNIDPKSPTEMTSSALFTQSMKSFADQYNYVGVNLNIDRFLAQYLTPTTYTDEARYDFQNRGVPDAQWNEYYRDVLIDLRDAKEIQQAVPATSEIAEKISNNIVASIDIMEAFSFSILVELFGNVPYSEALQGGNGSDYSQPKYDDASEIYKAQIDLLKAAIASISVDQVGFDSGDILFDGDMSEWKKFGSTLLMRLGMRLADSDPAYAESVVVAAMVDAYQVGEEADFHFLASNPYQNGVYEYFLTRWDIVPANTIVDMMNTLEDPRRVGYFTPLEDGSYKGLEYGALEGGDYELFSHIAFQDDATFPTVFADGVEVEFILAEAVERGFAVSGSAEDHYNSAVKGSILRWGGSESDANTYLAREDVAYSTAEGDFKQKIGTQKWISNYNNSHEGWTEWRRLDWPKLNVPDNGLTYEDIPERYPYPYSEETMNGINYAEAVEAMGGDTDQIKLFWDIY